MRSHRLRAALAVLAVVAVSGSCTTAEAPDGAAAAAPHREGAGAPHREEAGAPQRLAVDSPRSSDGVVAAGGADAPYNYAPSVLVENGGVRMWWCSQYGSAAPAGDDILHGQAPTPDGPFTGPGGGIPRAVFSGEPGGFDAVHTCDPSVLRVDGTYYLYYTGAAGQRPHGNAIGLATSDDGVHWTRVGDGPVVTPAHDTHRDNTYGAGQPTAVYLDGWFYLMFTDTTARAAGWNGAGQFVLRSPDPAFADSVEALGPDGFAPVSATDAPRTASVVDAFSADLMFADALGAFVVAHQTYRGTTLTFTGRDFTSTPYEPVVIDSRWQEGPGLLRRPDGHAPVSERAVCGRVPFDVVHATVLGRAGAPTALRRFGIDVRGIDGCADPGRALGLLEGSAVPSPMRTMDLVVDGRLLRVDRSSVAEDLARRALDHRPGALDRAPVAGRLRAGAPAVRAAGLGSAFVLDGTLWPVSSEHALRRNGSRARDIGRAEWASYRLGPVLAYREDAEF